MANKRTAPSRIRTTPKPPLQVIHVRTFRPDLNTLSNFDCGVDLSGYAYEGLKKWK
ncbi:MAG: hypothetical protein IKZ97_07595 [Butyrivibrio sp.]|nr:hypothetical protein [Butyrivibrio sp.]